MRLIDGDALKEEIEFHPTSVSVCATVEQARGETKFKLRCLEDIDNAPTIDAIPVKWLIEQRGRNDPKSVMDMEMAFTTICIDGVLALWRKEREARRDVAEAAAVQARMGAGAVGLDDGAV